MADRDSNGFESSTPTAINLREITTSTVTLTVTVLMLVIIYVARKLFNSVNSHGLPPHISSAIPYIGHAFSFGLAPVEFLMAAYEKYGPVFSFTMAGKTFTYLIGSEASKFFFDPKTEQLNIKDVYGKLLKPLCGEGVAYDGPDHILMQQRKMLKSGFTITCFRCYVPLIAQETVGYVSNWGESGQKDIHESLSNLIILTTSSCLHGKEIRGMMNKEMAQMYFHLTDAFSYEAWLLPSWFPLPSFRKRDKAHLKLKQIFRNAVQIRRNAKVKDDDMLQTLIDSTYKNGRTLTDNEIASMLIGFLIGGQHTSSAASSWLGFFLAKHKDIQQACYEEQVKAFGKDNLAADYDGLNKCPLLERCLKESLRLVPPPMTLVRTCKSPLNVMGYTIPPGHQVCVSPTVNHCLPEAWKDSKEFLPDRFLHVRGMGTNEKFSYIPFGAGPHRCIGEAFANLQVRTIWSLLLRMYEFDLVDGHFPKVTVMSMFNYPRQPIIAYKRRM